MQQTAPKPQPRKKDNAICHQEKPNRPINYPCAKGSAQVSAALERGEEDQEEGAAGEKETCLSPRAGAAIWQGVGHGEVGSARAPSTPGLVLCAPAGRG